MPLPSVLPAPVAVGIGAGRWSARRWGTTIGGLLAAQLLLIFVFADRVSVRPPARLARDTVRFVTDPRGVGGLSDASWLADPAQFALVSAHGFTGPLWQQLVRVEPQALEWSEPPRWLTLNLTQAVGAAKPPSALAATVASDVVQRPTPAAVLPLVPDSPTLTNSFLRIEGELARLQLLTPLELPRWAADDILVPSTVQVLVTREGLVLSAAVLDGGSGLPAADQRAVQLARSARFEPPAAATPGLGLTWGRLVFCWQTIEPPGPRAAKP